MSDEKETPFERYFRPGGPGNTPAHEDDGFGPLADTGELGAPVAVGGVPAPRVPVGRRRVVRDNRRQRRALIATGTASALVLAGSGAAWGVQSYLTGSVGTRHVAGLSSGPHGEMNILIAGVDRREGLTAAQQAQLHLGHDAGARSDTMLIVHLSADHRRVSVVSLPRDSYVTIPAHRSDGDEGPKGAPVPARYGKLTWAYGFGGSDLTVATIKQATGLTIDHYIEVNFVGFVKVVDAVGGVDICTPQAINDDKSGLHLPAGKSHVDGIKALGYARARYTLGDGSDLGRIDRQQKFMATLMHTALSAKTLTDPFKAAAFLKATLNSLTVDDGLARNLPALADQMKDLSTDSVNFAKIPLSNTDFRAHLWNSPQAQSTVVWDQKGASALFKSITDDQPLVKATPTPSLTPGAPGALARQQAGGGLTVPPSKITVRVGNGVGTYGLARKAADDLRKAGFVPVVLPGIQGRGQATTLIEYGRNRADSARTLAAALPGAKLKEIDSLGPTVQVIVGGDWAGAKKVTVAASPPAQAQNTAKTATENVLCK